MTYILATVMPDPLTYCTGLGLKPLFWHCKDTADPIVPQWESLILFMFGCTHGMQFLGHNLLHHRGTPQREGFVCLFLFRFFRAAPAAYGGFQSRCQIGAVATGLRHSHSNADPASATYTTAHGNARSLTH